ncbi:MAG: hypothetical protein AB7O86_05595 [Porticoccaceae bacterium]
MSAELNAAEAINQDHKNRWRQALIDHGLDPDERASYFKLDGDTIRLLDEQTRQQFVVLSGNAEYNAPPKRNANIVAATAWVKENAGQIGTILELATMASVPESAMRSVKASLPAYFTQLNHGTFQVINGERQANKPAPSASESAAEVARMLAQLTGHAS